MSASNISGVSTEQRQQLREWPSFYFEKVLGIEPFDYQSDFLDSPYSRKQLCCGRQVGKTEICAGDGLQDATVHNGHEVLIVAPTQRQSSNLFRRVKTMMSESPIEDWGITRETKTIIEFENGSRIICLPAGTDGSTIRGYTADYIIVDEAAFVPNEVFTSVLNPMLATTDGTMVLASTPFGTSGFFYNASVSERWETFEVKTADSPLVGPDFIEQQRDELTETEFKQEILGEFVPGSDVYIKRELVMPQVSDTLPDTGMGRSWLGVDVARKGSDRTVFTGLDEHGSVFLIESEDTSSMPGILGRIKSLDAKLNFTSVLIDENAVGGGVVDFGTESPELAGRVIPVTFSSTTKDTMYRGLKKAFETGGIAIPDHRRLIHELTSLEYDFTATGKLKVSHPPNGHDDFPDSLALSNYGRMQQGRSKSSDRGVRSF